MSLKDFIEESEQERENMYNGGDAKYMAEAIESQKETNHVISDAMDYLLELMKESDGLPSIPQMRKRIEDVGPLYWGRASVLVDIIIHMHESSAGIIAGGGIKAKVMKTTQILTIAKTLSELEKKDKGEK